MIYYLLVHFLRMLLYTMFDLFVQYIDYVCLFIKLSLYLLMMVSLSLFLLGVRLFDLFCSSGDPRCVGNTELSSKIFSI